MAAEDLAKEIRAWLATQPNTPSDAKNVGAALADSTQPQGDNENSYPSPEDMARTGKIIRDEFIKEITPEQAVAALVEKGAELHKHTINVVVENGEAGLSVAKTWMFPRNVLVLPPATPKVTP